ncbi:hypothetical protein KFL_006920050 [Klebsormidium nitens]|uniref:Uncharacterized protein n=1 Tax=Klebsormidium nitens TaxID=105231 RepID=A0A1Y1INU7_KLENI|nr:hypothetical protein KFL_006920050 [Klebsormidium nitens]|eukprot:GAQ90851.1 hypothetical protein KFL_006920050 [Klebsormidium nitens]
MGVEFVFCDEKGKVVDCISGCKSLWYGYEQKTPKFDYNQSLKDVAGLDDKALDSQGMRAFAADIHYYLEEEFPWVLRKEDAEVYKPDLERLKELVEAQNFTELLAFYERELEVRPGPEIPRLGFHSLLMKKAGAIEKSEGTMAILRPTGATSRVTSRVEPASQEGDEVFRFPKSKRRFTPMERDLPTAFVLCSFAIAASILFLAHSVRRPW